MTQILFRGWNLPDYTKIFGVSAGGRRCFRARDATAYPVALLGLEIPPFFSLFGSLLIGTSSTNGRFAMARFDCGNW